MLYAILIVLLAVCFIAAVAISVNDNSKIDQLTAKIKAMTDIETKRAADHSAEINCLTQKINKQQLIIKSYETTLSKLNASIASKDKEIIAVQDKAQQDSLLLTQQHISEVTALNQEKESFYQQCEELRLYCRNLCYERDLYKRKYYKAASLVNGYCKQAKQLQQVNARIALINTLQRKLLTPDDRIYIDFLYKKNYYMEKIEAEFEMEVAFDKTIAAKQKEIDRLNLHIENLKSQIIELSDKVLLQSYSLYEPKYNFATSDEYKERLNEIRAIQKNLIKNKTAAKCYTKWTINDSVREGKKVANAQIKSILNTFNTECDNVMSKVKFNNFDSMEERITKMYERLNSLYEAMRVKITEEYYKSKLDELALVYEYAKKKQEERERRKEELAIQRENEKVQKEIEEANERLEKEKSHCLSQLNKLNEQLLVTQDIYRREIIKGKQQALQDEINDIEINIADNEKHLANERMGYVYVISNIGSFGEGIYKIGMTRRLEPRDRIDELGGASVPFKFDIHALIFSEDAPSLETALHNRFANRKVNMVNGRKEFFRVSLEEIEEAVREYKNKYDTVEFVQEAYAEQYRESQRILAQINI